MNSLTINTATACVAFGTFQLRVYFQDSEDYVREARGGAWTGGTINDRLFRAKPNTPLAAFVCGSKIWIYYVDNNGILQEHCLDATGWFTGSLGSRNIRVDHRSKIAACFWGATPSIRVYCQLPNNPAIREVCWNGVGWIWGAILPDAQFGSSLAAVQFQQGETHLRVYYQARDNTILEHCWDGSWLPGHRLGKGPAGTAIGAIAWGGGPQIRVCYEEPEGNGGIIQEDYQPQDGWNRYRPMYLTSTLPNTSLSLCCWGSTEIRYYYQRVPDEVQELGWNQGRGLFLGPKIPTN